MAHENEEENISRREAGIVVQTSLVGNAYSLKSNDALARSPYNPQVSTAKRESKHNSSTNHSKLHIIIGSQDSDLKTTVMNKDQDTESVHAPGCTKSDEGCNSQPLMMVIENRETSGGKKANHPPGSSHARTPNSSNVLQLEDSRSPNLRPKHLGDNFGTTAEQIKYSGLKGLIRREEESMENIEKEINDSILLMQEQEKILTQPTSKGSTQLKHFNNFSNMNYQKKGIKNIELPLKSKRPQTTD